MAYDRTRNQSSRGRDPVPLATYYGTPVRGNGLGAIASFFCARTFYGRHVQAIGFETGRGAVRANGAPRTMLKTFMAVAVASVMLSGLPGAAGAQEAANEGAFSSLSPGGQKIATAIHDAQPEGGIGGGETAAPLSLDDIAAAKQDGRGWGQFFGELKANGQVQGKNLGQAVSRSHHAATTTTVTYGNGRVVTHVGARGGKHGAAARASGSARGAILGRGEAARTGGRNGTAPRIVTGNGGRAAGIVAGTSNAAAAGRGAHGGGHPRGKPK